MWHYFTDPVLRGPTLGSMLMCLASALVGVIVFLRKESLVGETLSHAAYPGVILGVAAAGALHYSGVYEWTQTLLILGCAFTTSLLGLLSIAFLQRNFSIRADSALCFVLSVFFGIGVTLASRVQFTEAILYTQVQTYLFGQAATMQDGHILLYGALSLVCIALFAAIFKELKTITFDPLYAKSIAIPVKWIEALFFILITSAVVIGIRSVGVVLMSAMLIAPAAAARQCTNHLFRMFLIAGLIGLLSGFFGTYLSSEATVYLANHYPASRLSIPTGPMIVLCASFTCLLALFFAPERGMMLRVVRIWRFRFHCICENILKLLWRNKGGLSIRQVGGYQAASLLYLRLIMLYLRRNGWIKRYPGGVFTLTHDGQLWGGRIVRLHRLWELYLTDELGVGVERVHRSAEEMEHILTPEIEERLTNLLKDPKRDPHKQPIPPREEL